MLLLFLLLLLLLLLLLPLLLLPVLKLLLLLLFRVETNCSFVISNSSSSNERIFEYFRILDRKAVANPMFEIPIGQEVKYNIP